MDRSEFQLPHAEKIQWMIDTSGFAIEPVAPVPDSDPPSPAYSYSIGLPAAVDFPEVAVFGLTPVAAKGLIGLVADARRGSTDIPIGVELVGLLDNDLRCAFAPIDLDVWEPMFTTAVAWYAGEPFSMVQLYFPDRRGVMPYESGYDERMRYAQPVIGSFE
jgi:hypothetical protein